VSLASLQVLLRVTLVAAAVAVLATGSGTARAGGTPVGFVSLPAGGALVVVELPGGGTVARVGVPGEPAAVAASMNGRRVLVVSPNAGAVTEIDGIHNRVLRVFHGFAHPTDVAFDYEPPVGIVTPRFAFVLERARATLAVLDLARGRIATRLAVGARPEQLAVDGTTLWIAHAADSTLTRVNVTSPTRPRLLVSLDTGRTVGALVADPDLDSVFVSFRGSGRIARYVDGGARARRAYVTRIAARPLAGVAVAAPHLLIAADRRGSLDLMREQDGRPLSQLRAPDRIRSLDAYGGWLVAILPRGLSLLAVPSGSMRTSIPFESPVGGFASAVL
jgi:hypothetical protein